MDAEGSITFTVIDQLGKTVWAKQLESGETEAIINLAESGLANGVYFVTAVSKGERLTQRLTVAK